MTAEIAVMNREAVALAADSAVTSRMQSGQKISASGNKLFALSYYHPIGIMIYNNALFMEMPWETVIKTFRKVIPTAGYDKLSDYVDNFVSFLENNNILFPYDLRTRFVDSFIQGYFVAVRSDIEKRVSAIITEKGQIDDQQTEKIVEEVLQNHNKRWENEPIGSIPLEKSNTIIEKNRGKYDEGISLIFKKLPLSEKSLASLFELAVSVLSRGTRNEFNSGVVVAGFGEKEFFPSIVHFTVDGLADDRLKLHGKISSTTNYNLPSLIVPFAQKEMVYRFMEGVDPIYKGTELGYISELLNTFATKVVDNIHKEDSAEKTKLKEELTAIGKTLSKDFEEKMKSFVLKQFVTPITNVVSLLQKNELAILAETLVTLTTQKRQFSAEEETVKGPIDVALITKGDGFIWIQRKHYFKPELNPHFLTNRFRS